MKTRKTMIFLVMLSALLLQACGASQADIATQVAQALYISGLETAAAGGGVAGQDQPPAEEGRPSNTPFPTDTPAPAIAYVSVSQDTNCRNGPRLDYALLTNINAGQQVEVLKTFSNDYVVVKKPSGSGDCWLWLRYANTTNFSAYNLPVATQPPTPAPTPTFTPTPEFIWDGDWQMVLSTGSVILVNIDVSGNTLSGSFPIGAGATLSFSLSLNSSKQNASGTYTVDIGPHGTVQWMIKSDNPNQFIGSYSNGDGSSLEWCGWRAGASKPSPCQWP